MRSDTNGYSVIGEIGQAPNEKEADAPVGTSVSPNAPQPIPRVATSLKPRGRTISERTFYTGCYGRPATAQLGFSIVGRNANSGLIVVNGVDIRKPHTALTWEWGDGTTTQGWFPQSHTYSVPPHGYRLRVISHEDDGSTDCAQLVVGFPPTQSSVLTPQPCAFDPRVCPNSLALK